MAVMTFTKTEYWEKLNGAQAIYQNITPQENQFITLYRADLVPWVSQSRDVTLNLESLPRGAVIKSVHLTYSTKISSTITGYTTNWIITPDISGSGTIDEQILNYLQQEEVPSDLLVRFVLAFTRHNQIPVGSSNPAPEQAFLTATTATLEVTYEETQSSTISFGVNNAWQKCNVFFGTGGEWKQCKAFFGADGAWKETQ